MYTCHSFGLLVIVISHTIVMTRKNLLGLPQIATLLVKTTNSEIPSLTTQAYIIHYIDLRPHHNIY